MKNYGFTLIELSIVLVIIGLLVGGILTGKDLIRTAARDAQISQLTKYNTAVNIFQTKYNYLPGDMPPAVAGNYGFFNTGMTGASGLGNADQQINSPNTSGYGECLDGEPYVFWQHLSAAGLIDGNYGASLASGGQPSGNQDQSKVNTWFPAGKIGYGSDVVVYTSNGSNYWEIMTLANVGGSALMPGGGGGGGGNSDYNSTPAMTPNDAYFIDKKIDDGFPLSGNVQSVRAGNWIGAPPLANDGCAVSGSPTTYDIKTGNANLVNCDLSIQWQGN